MCYLYFLLIMDDIHVIPSLAFILLGIIQRIRAQKA